MRFLLPIIFSLLAFPAFAQNATTISGLPFGGRQLPTDAIPATRNGVTYKVNPYSVPAANNLVTSTGTGLSATGIAPVNGDCVVGANGAWTASSCPGSSYTAGTGLTLSGTAFNVNSSQSISALSNLSMNGFVTTSGSNGTLAITSPPLGTTIGGTGATTAGAALDNLTGASSLLGQWLNRTAVGTWTSTSATTVIGQCFLNDFSPSFASETELQQGIDRQNWLLSCQRQAIALGAPSKSNISNRQACVEAIDSVTPFFSAKSSTPILIPRYVCARFSTVFTRDGSAGTITANWTGDPSTQALANIYEPLFIVPPTGQVTGDLKMVLNSNGSDNGSGLFYGKTWRVKTLTIDSANQGSGFVGGETCTMINGDTQGPAAGATFTCATASAGKCSTITYSPTRYQPATGQYYLPPFQQAQQYTAANGWNGGDVYHPSVFNASGSYKTTCSASGVGLGVTPTWWSDWESGDTTYDGFFGNVSPSTGYLHNIYAQQSGQSTSGTYGSTWAVAGEPFDLDVDEIQTSFSVWGTYFTCCDVRVKVLNDVGSTVGLKVASGGSMEFSNVVLDSPTDTINSSAHCLEVDNVENLKINGVCFHNSNSSTMAGNMIRLGANGGGSSAYNRNLDINLTMMTESSTSTTLTALGCAYTTGSRINLNVNNLNASNGALTQQITSFLSNGTDCDSSNDIGGHINNVTNSGVGKVQVVGSGAAGWTNTGISTSQEINLVSVALPPMGPNDAIRVYTLWTRGGTLTNTDDLAVRLSTTGCTSGTACAPGTAYMYLGANSSGQTTVQTPALLINNRNATNSQVAFNNASSTNTTTSGAVTTGTVQTNATPFVNIGCQTAGSTADSCKLEAYTVELIHN